MEKTMKKPIMEKSIMEKTAIGNITTVGKTTVEKTTIAKITAKMHNNCLAVFFGIVHLDDKFKSPGSSGQLQIWFLRWVCVFAGLSGRQQQKYF